MFMLNLNVNDLCIDYSTSKQIIEGTTNVRGKLYDSFGFKFSCFGMDVFYLQVSS